MEQARNRFYEKRAEVLVQNMTKRGFEAYYCEDRQQALKKALELIPEGATVGWGGAYSATQIGLLEALELGSYHTLNRDKAAGMDERLQMQRRCFDADVFLTGANALSLTGEMVNIDGTGNRVGMIVYGPKNVLVIAGMNKVVSTLEDAVHRARTVAAPMNAQRFGLSTPCSVTGACGDCKGECSICNQLLVTRNSRPVGRIKVILVGEDLGY